jgi:hypothetical protein
MQTLLSKITGAQCPHNPRVQVIVQRHPAERPAAAESQIEKFGRGEWIRTTGLLVPNREDDENQ